MMKKKVLFSYVRRAVSLSRAPRPSGWDSGDGHRPAHL